MLNWNDQAVEARMRTGWRGGLSEGTPCGSGSARKKTRAVRERIPALLRELNIRTVCEAGAGDMYWSGTAFSGVDYRPFDLVPRHDTVGKLDITKDRLPACDLIVCRQVLIHLDPPRIRQALELFRQAGAWLLASQYDNAAGFDPGKDFNPTDLRGLLGEPIERIPDADCSLALWMLAC